MKRGDIFWILALFACIGFVISPFTHDLFLQTTKAYPFLSGFVKFAILATMGEILAIRIVVGDWKKPKGLVARIVIWGIIGVIITLMFNVFAHGIKGILSNGLIPGGDSKYAFAIWVSVIMNLIFAPTFMAFHRYTDTYIDFFYEGKSGIKVVDITKAIDWNGFVSFIIIKTIPFFWIPAHFITFLLPSAYRVLVAAFLSIALGAILAFGKRKR